MKRLPFLLNLLATISVAAVGSVAHAAVESFVLACTPTSSAAATISDYDLTIRSVAVTYADGGIEMRINPSTDGRVFSASAAEDTVVEERLVVAAWGDEDTWFRATSQDGRRFEGELIYVEDFLVPVSCLKIVTENRDDDEFSLVCTPVSDDSATIKDYDLVIRDVVLFFEDRDLEMRVNATTGDPQIFDLERASNVVVNDRRIAASWDDQDTWFEATSSDGQTYDAELIYVEDFLVPLTCKKI